MSTRTEPAESIAVVSVSVPGAFESFFTGTGVYAGQTWSDDPDEERAAQELAAAWRDARHVKRGKGKSIELMHLSLGAALVLAEYAEADRLQRVLAHPRRRARLMRLSGLLRRSSSTIRDLEVLSTGNPERIAKRAGNKAIGRALGRVTRKVWFR